MKIGKIDFLSEVKEKKIEKITINVSLENLTDDCLEELLAMINDSAGNTAVYVNIKDFESKTNIPLISRTHTINVTKELTDFLTDKDMFSYVIN